MKVKRAVKYRVTCPHCGSELEFILDEVDFDRSSCTEFGGYVKCPTCGRRIQTHDGYWTSNEFYLLKTVEVICEEQEFELRPLNEPDSETEEALKILLQKQEGDKK